MDWNNLEIKMSVILPLILVLSLVTVFLHTVASSITHRVTHAIITRVKKTPNLIDETIIVSTVVILLTLFHVLEVIFWALAFLVLGAVANPQDAFYISLTAYTTLGADDVTFDQRFRYLLGFESLVGPLMIAWSTAVMATVLSRIAALRMPTIK